MDAPRRFQPGSLVLAALLGLGLFAGSDAQAGSDRIFANGFDPCCQIGGTVSGLTGSGLALHLDAGAVSEDLPIAANGLYQFAASVPTGTAYTVSVGSQPTGQNCHVANATGTIGSNDVDNVDVACGAIPALIWDQGDWGQDWQ